MYPQKKHIVVVTIFGAFDCDFTHNYTWTKENMLMIKLNFGIS
jgi:hypothetical protein